MQGRKPTMPAPVAVLLPPHSRRQSSGAMARGHFRYDPRELCRFDGRLGVCSGVVRIIHGLRALS
jgi:hypothetical protein